jgi:hypothetical protein
MSAHREARSPSRAAARPRREPPLSVLRRWEESGAIWRVRSRVGSRIEIALLTCTGAEEVDRLTSDDPDLLAFVGDRAGSDDRDPA